MFDLGFIPGACCWVHRRGQAQSLLALCVACRFRLCFERGPYLCTGPRRTHRRSVSTMAEVRITPSIRSKRYINRQCTSSPYVPLPPSLDTPPTHLLDPDSTPTCTTQSSPPTPLAHSSTGNRTNPGSRLQRRASGPSSRRQTYTSSKSHARLRRASPFRQTRHTLSR